MREWQSQSHVRWYCRYHIVFIPKYRKKVIYGQLRKDIGRVFRQLCEQQA
jgi:putative transposase